MIEWIREAKAELNARGIQTEGVGPIGPFQIINLAAWRHRERGIGLLDKPNGNHAEFPAGSGNFYSTDWLIFRNGEGGDMLIGAETDNIPAWNMNHDPDLASRWRPPVDPGFDDAKPVEPAPEPKPEIIVVLSPAVMARLDELAALVVSENEKTRERFEEIRRDLERTARQLLGSR